MVREVVSARPVLVAAMGPACGATNGGLVRRSDVDTDDEIKTRMGEAEAQAKCIAEVASF